MPQSQILKAQRFFLLAALLLYLLSTQVFSQITPDPSSLTPSPATLLRTGLVHLTDEEKAWLNQRNGVIRLAPDPFFPPLEWFDEQGEYRGFVADCFKMIEARLGAKIEVIRCRTWDEVLEKAKRHEIDGITAAQITPERRAYLAFTPSLIDIPNVIIMRRDAEGPLEFSRMKGMSIVVTRGNALHEYLGRKHPDVNLLLKDDDLTCLQDVSFGRADATVINLAIAAWLIEKHGISNLRVVGDSGKTNQLAIACRIDQPLMLSIMEKGLASISDAERREIYKKWVILDRVESIPSEEFWRLLRYAAMILTAVLTVFYIWNRTLQRQVALRTDELKAELIARQGAEKALVEEKERLAVTLTSIGEGVVTTDIAGRVTLMNRIAAELTG
ncbi:MAG TPA: transporter substrate-binding domain-containing protein, partial [Candidatus Ozemobacteraceae bacterium]|nr:transporter substrate-binding domain-containing protein [Candidatus Ozemobacteraceae bacterium]